MKIWDNRVYTGRDPQLALLTRKKAEMFERLNALIEVLEGGGKGKVFILRGDVQNRLKQLRQEVELTTAKHPIDGDYEEEYKLLMAIEGCVKDSSNCVAAEGYSGEKFCGIQDIKMRCPF